MAQEIYRTRAATLYLNQSLKADARSKMSNEQFQEKVQQLLATPRKIKPFALFECYDVLSLLPKTSTTVDLTDEVANKENADFNSKGRRDIRKVCSHVRCLHACISARIVLS